MHPRRLDLFIAIVPFFTLGQWLLDMKENEKDWFLFPKERRREEMGEKEKMGGEEKPGKFWKVDTKWVIVY